MKRNRESHNYIRAKFIEMYLTSNYSIRKISRIMGIQHGSGYEWVIKYFGLDEQNQYGLKSKV